MKLRRKLLSAGFALGATALTLTTSTFAWYTSNDVVTVDKFSGITSATADASSVYVAAAQTYAEGNKKGATFGTYTANATPVLTSNAVLDTVGNTNTSTTVTKTTLQPVYFNTSDKSLKRMTNASGSTATYASTETATDYLEFVLRFRAANPGTAIPMYFSGITLENTSEASDYKQIALVYGDNTGPTAAGEYAVDVIKALKLAVVSYNMTDSTTASTTATATNIYGFESMAASDTNFTSASTYPNPNADAVAYYNAVLGTELDVSNVTNYNAGTEVKTATAGTLTSSTAVSPFTIPDTGYVEVYFALYLDGWDNYCYDVCRQQNISVTLNFTASPEKAVIQAAA